MQINVGRDQLLKPLSYVAAIVERRQTLPILSFVLLRTAEGSTTLTGTDLEVEIVATISDAKTKQDDALVLPARKLLDICRSLPPETEVAIKTDGERAVLMAGRSRFTLLTLPAADFPSIQTEQWEQELRIKCHDLEEMLTQTQFCMAQQDVRYYLNGLLLEIEEKHIRAVATDGHRLGLTEIALDTTTGQQKQVIIPRKAIHEIAKILANGGETVTVKIGRNHVRFETDDVVFTATLIDGRYPDYSKVMPSSQNKFIKINRQDLRETLQRVAILASEKQRGVRFSLEPGSLKIIAHNPENEEAKDELNIDYTGETVEIGFNVEYITDALNGLRTEQVVMGLKDSNSSCTIRSPDNKVPQYVIMPMRL